MKLTLNQSEMQAMCSLLAETCENMRGMFSALDMEEKLFLAIFEEMNLHFQRRGLELRKQYQSQFKPHWAIAFHLQFSGMVDRKTYMGNLTQQICDRIDQIHS